MEIEYEYDYFQMYQREMVEKQALLDEIARLKEELESTKKELSEAYEVILNKEEAK